jgi:O-antigen ligase
MLSASTLMTLNYRLILLYSFVLPWSQFVSIRLIVLSAILSTCHLKNLARLIPFTWPNIAYFLVLIVGLVYSSNTELGMKVLETNASILLVPISFASIIGRAPQQLNKVGLFFVLGLITSASFSFVLALMDYYKYNDIGQLYFYELLSPINSHPTYYAYYIVFSLTYCLYIIKYENLNIPKWSIALMVVFLFLILILTGGQTAFVALLFVFSFFLLKFFLGQSKTANDRLSFLLIVAMLIVMIIVSSGSSSQREQTLDDSWDRFELWRAAILANSNPFTGVGTGDYKQVLHQYYVDHNQLAFANDDLNSHNQFIQMFFSNGLIGLIALLIMLIRPLYLAFRRNHQFGVLIIFSFLIYGMTEVFLGRFQGVVFFALLHSVLSVHYSQENLHIKE